MNRELQANTRKTGIQLTAVLLIFTLLGIAFALMVRKEQSLIKQRASHRKIVANLPILEEDTRLIRQQLTNFRQLMPEDGARRSAELLVFSRIDQILSTFPQGVATVSGLEKKEGRASLTFSIKFPLQNYAQVINGFGKMQTETFPFVTVNKVTVDGTKNGQLSIDGSVIMPLSTEGGS